MNEDDRPGGAAVRLDALPREEAAGALRSCCASERWGERMLRLRPFGDDDALFEAAERIWWDLEADDWLEAFAAHPRIGERTTSPVDPDGRTAGPPTSQPDGPEEGDRDRAGGGDRRAGEWSRQEQSGVAGSDAATRRALEEGNRAYEERFGHVFLIFAAGRSGEEMLAELHERLDNDPEEELRIAAREQAAITRHRLEKLAGNPTDEEERER